MSVTKHRDAQLFAAPCEFCEPVTFKKPITAKEPFTFSKVVDATAGGIVLGTVPTQNTLDFFNKGIPWLPELWDESNTPKTGAYTTQVGKFFEFGNRVFFEVHIKMISLGSLILSNAANIGNLPVPMKAGTIGSCWVNQLVGFNLPGLFGVSGRYDPANQAIRLMMMNQTGGHASVQITEVSADGDLKMSGHYEKA